MRFNQLNKNETNCYYYANNYGFFLKTSLKHQKPETLYVQAFDMFSVFLIQLFKNCNFVHQQLAITVLRDAGTLADGGFNLKFYISCTAGFK